MSMKVFIMLRFKMMRFLVLLIYYQDFLLILYLQNNQWIEYYKHFINNGRVWNIMIIVIKLLQKINIHIVNFILAI